MRRACSASFAATRSRIFSAAVSVSVDCCLGRLHRLHIVKHSRRRLLASSLGVLPVQVLEDSLRVVDHLVAVDQHRHAALAGQLLDLGPAPRACREPARSRARARACAAGARPRRTGRARWSASGSGRGRRLIRRPAAPRRRTQAADRAQREPLGPALPGRGRRAARAARRPRPRASPRAGAARSRARAWPSCCGRSTTARPSGSRRATAGSGSPSRAAPPRRRRARSPPGSFSGGGVDAGDPRQVGEQAVEGEVAPAEDVALADLALLVGEQVAGGDVADVDDVERAVDVGGDLAAAGSGAPGPSRCRLGSSGPSTKVGLTITTGSP